LVFVFLPFLKQPQIQKGINGAQADDTSQQLLIGLLPKAKFSILALKGIKSLTVGSTTTEPVPCSARPITIGMILSKQPSVSIIVLLINPLA
jgi:hypothetical protein